MTGAAHPEAPHRPDWTGKRAVVMGLGRFGGGVGAARYLAEQGARVLVTDQGTPESLAASVEALADLDLEFVLGEHRADDFEHAEVVVANPAVAPTNPLLQAARSSGAHITSEIELFLGASPARAACITGTQGKSSTCHLLAQLLTHTGTPTMLGGNIGVSLLQELATLTAEHVVVLELSSYQLEALGHPQSLATRPAVCAITNVLADHLERHQNIARYAKAKLRILELAPPESTVFLPGEDERLWEALPAGVRRVPHWDAREGAPGVSFDEEHFVFEGKELGRLEDLALPGQFQRRNTALALAMAHTLGASAEALARALPRLQGLPHRFQDLGTVAGRRIWDNGVSTTPDSTVAALRSVENGCTLLVGGEKKALDYEPLFRAAREHDVRAVTFGAAGTWLAEGFRRAEVPVSFETRFEAAVARALESTPVGGHLLFSPACASFDAYANFLARAEHFRERIHTVKA